MSEVVPLKTEKEVAADLVERFKPLLEQQAELMNEATSRGLIVQWSIGKDAFGRSRLTDINVTKVIL